METLLVTGKVVSTKDPKGLCRVQVKLEGTDKPVELPWMRMAHAYASKEFGAVLLPEENDEVLVMRGQGDSHAHMYCVGVLYNGTQKPPQPNDDGKNNIKELKTRSGHRISINDESGSESIVIETPDAKLSIEFAHPDGTITIKTSDKVVVDSKEVTVKGADKVAVEGKNVDVKGDEVTVKGKNVTVKGDSKVEVKAASIAISGNVDIG